MIYESSKLPGKKRTCILATVIFRRAHKTGNIFCFQFRIKQALEHFKLTLFQEENLKWLRYFSHRYAQDHKIKQGYPC